MRKSPHSGGGYPRPNRVCRRRGGHSAPAASGTEGAAVAYSAHNRSCSTHARRLARLSPAGLGPRSQPRRQQVPEPRNELVFGGFSGHRACATFSVSHCKAASAPPGKILPVHSLAAIRAAIWSASTSAPRTLAGLVTTPPPGSSAAKLTPDRLPPQGRPDHRAAGLAVVGTHPCRSRSVAPRPCRRGPAELRRQDQRYWHHRYWHHTGRFADASGRRGGGVGHAVGSRGWIVAYRG